MSLVDYASSSEEEVEEEEEEEKTKLDEYGPPPRRPPQLPPSNPQNRGINASFHQQSDGASSSPQSIEKLPDASMLLASPSFTSHQMNGSDHSSRVAAAMAESATQKRESNGSVLPHPRRKHPRGNLRYLRNLPDTVGGQLIPPQVTGRSNVVTEDIGKLFVSRNSEPSHEL